MHDYQPEKIERKPDYDELTVKVRITKELLDDEFANPEAVANLIAGEAQRIAKAAVLRRING